jgi:hypothetical protein
MKRRLKMSRLKKLIEKLDQAVNNSLERSYDDYMSGAYTLSKKKNKQLRKEWKKKKSKLGIK